jgi:hypothetical protein
MPPTIIPAAGLDVLDGGGEDSDEESAIELVDVSAGTRELV